MVFREVLKVGQDATVIPVFMIVRLGIDDFLKTSSHFNSHKGIRDTGAKVVNRDQQEAKMAAIFEAVFPSP